MDKKYKSYDGETSDIALALAHFFKYSLVVFFKLKTKQKSITKVTVGILCVHLNQGEDAITNTK